MYQIALKRVKTCFHELCGRQELAEEHSKTGQSRKGPAWDFPGKINSGSGGTGNGKSSKLYQDSHQPRSTNL